MKVKIGTRKSALARIQARAVAQALEAADPHTQVELVLKDSQGDRDQTSSLVSFASKGVFTEDLYRALVEGEIDLAVHSWKDLPTEPRAQTKVAATLTRADPRDMLVLRKEAYAREKLIVLSSSPRREFNLKDFLPIALPWKVEELSFAPVRGNIETRLRKLLAGEGEALVVAKAAIDRLLSSAEAEFSESREFIRLALEQCYLCILPLSANPCAPGQGALAIECRSDRQDLVSLLARVNQPDVFEAVELERAKLQDYGGGCHQKLGIAVLRRPYGLVYFSRGAPAEAFVEVAEIQAGLAVPQAGGRDRIWPERESSFSFKRQVVPHSVKLENDTAIFCAKDSAWPESLACKPETVVWAAGVSTWKSLAARGIWVHGCNDSLGEQEDFSISSLFPSVKSWIKLSHSNAKKGKFDNLIATYSLEAEKIPSKEELLKYSHFYWSSSSQFELAIKNAPELLDRVHGCGPGATYQLIRSQVKDFSKLSTHLNFGGFLEAALEQ